jgi:hypothetical protein
VRALRLLLLAACLAAPLPASAAAGDVLFREEFTNLDAWRPLTFPKIPKHSVYTIGSDEAQAKFWLRAEADASASGIVWKKTFNVLAYPRLRWRWKVDAIYRKGDSGTKAGDDYPLRVYVIFAYDPATAGLAKRITYGTARALYGEYPPDSGLNYVWDSPVRPEEYVVSPYTDSMYMFLKEKGPAKVGQWVEEEADLLADYRKAFGKDPPATASLAVMNDADNTGEKSVSYLDWIEIGK